MTPSMIIDQASTFVFMALLLALALKVMDWV